MDEEAQQRGREARGTPGVFLPLSWDGDTETQSLPGWGFRAPRVNEESRSRVSVALGTERGRDLRAFFQPFAEPRVVLVFAPGSADTACGCGRGEPGGTQVRLPTAGPGARVPRRPVPVPAAVWARACGRGNGRTCLPHRKGSFLSPPFSFLLSP